jgi:oxygen-independent coproporphyrinogen-3 oxidase
MKKEYFPLGLYIHIPFCPHKCDYCDFYSLAGSDERMDEYERALCAHLAEVAPLAKQHTVDSVYFGGGTPSYFGVKRLKTVLAAVQKNYKLARDAEITLEANPDSAGDWKVLRALRRGGFNRISIGMQSSSDEELRACGRIHTFAQVQQAVEAARRAKLKNLSLDLIYGLPEQTMESWEKTLADAVALAPEHLSCYGLKVEEGTPFFAMRDTLPLADDDEQAEQYLFAVDFLRQAGYEQYEISNFAKPGFASRHNMKYWTLGEYVGFGPGAHSDFGGVRYGFERDLDKYIQGTLYGGKMPLEGDDLPGWTRDTEYLMLRFRTAQGVLPRDYENTFRQRFSVFLPLLEKYEAAGLACHAPSGAWRFTAKGFLVSNTLIGELLEALTAEKQRRMEAAARGDFRIKL